MKNLRTRRTGLDGFRLVGLLLWLSGAGLTAEVSAKDAAPPMVLAVAPFQVVGGEKEDEWLRWGCAGDLGNVFREMEGVRPVPLRELVQAVEDLQAEATEWQPGSAVKPLANRLGATFVITGEVEVQGKQWTLRASLTRVADLSLAGQAEVSGEAERFFDLLKEHGSTSTVSTPNWVTSIIPGRWLWTSGRAGAPRCAPAR